MARTRRSIAGQFLKSFEAARLNYDLAAVQLEKLIKEILINTPALIHVIKARCKESSSLWIKLCEKRYGQPKRQLTDLVAGRVITYYRDDVPVIVKALTNTLEINR